MPLCNMKTSVTMIKGFVKVVITTIDSLFKTDIDGRAQKLQSIWYSSNLLNTVRRMVLPAIVRFRYKLGMKVNGLLYLHLGCGENHFKGYINIDWRKTGATDMVCNIRKLPYSNNSVEVIETYHAIEHLPRHDLPKALKEWFRVLIRGGRLIIECPDFDEAVKEYIQGNEKRIDNIFGLQRFPGDAHLFGYNFKRLKLLLENYGFTDVQKKGPQDYHAKDEPCFRVECIKGNNS